MSGKLEEPVRVLESNTQIRTTVTVVDVSQLVIAVLVLGLYGYCLYRPINPPEELKAAIYVIVGAIISKRIPTS